VPKDVDAGTPEMAAFVLGSLDRSTRYGALYLSLARDVSAIAYLQKHGARPPKAASPSVGEVPKAIDGSPYSGTASLALAKNGTYASVARLV
jgi:hypothetical protein